MDKMTINRRLQAYQIMITLDIKWFTQFVLWQTIVFRQTFYYIGMECEIESSEILAFGQVESTGSDLA